MSGSRGLLAALLVALLPAAAPAQTYQYEFDVGGTTYTSGGTVTTGSLGSTLPVSVYIRETGTTLNTLGMNTAGALLTTSTPAAGARVLADGDIVGNVGAAGFSNTGAGFYVREAAFSGNPAQHRLTVADNLGESVVSGGANGRILVGTYTFTVEGSTPGVITASEVPGDTYNTLSNGTPIVVAPATLSFTPVPEPAALLALATTGLLVARLRRGG